MTVPKPLRLLIPLAALVLIAAQSVTPPRATVAPSRTTMDGVYTSAQAAEGRDLFASACQSCHTPTVHAGPPFRNKWFGRNLGEFFGYMRREMPKSDPGSLSDEEYATAIAYILRINGMPAGNVALIADSAALVNIRIDSVRLAPTTPGHRR